MAQGWSRGEIAGDFNAVLLLLHEIPTTRPIPRTPLTLPGRRGRPGGPAGPRRLVDWFNPRGAKKVHSLVDKVYQQKNLEMACECVQANRGSGGVDGQSLEQFAEQLGQQLGRLQRERQEDTYQPQPVRQVQIPKAGKPGEFRTFGNSYNL